MRYSVLPSLLVLLGGCVHLVPPQPAAPRPSTAVAASRDRVWDAVIEIFAEMNIPIRTIDRASGFLATEPLSVPPRTGKELAACGTIMGVAIPPDRAIYNVLVRESGSVSSVKVTIAFTQGGSAMDPTIINCTSRGVWEAAFEEKVRRIAETKASP